jgi:hypothetical protein
VRGSRGSPGPENTLLECCGGFATFPHFGVEFRTRGPCVSQIADTTPGWYRRVPQAHRPKQYMQLTTRMPPNTPTGPWVGPPENSHLGSAQSQLLLPSRHCFSRLARNNPRGGRPSADRCVPVLS